MIELLAFWICSQLAHGLPPSVPGATAMSQSGLYDERGPEQLCVFYAYERSGLPIGEVCVVRLGDRYEPTSIDEFHPAPEVAAKWRETMALAREID